MTFSNALREDLISAGFYILDGEPDFSCLGLKEEHPCAEPAPDPQGGREVSSFKSDDEDPSPGRSGGASKSEAAGDHQGALQSA